MPRTAGSARSVRCLVSATTTTGEDPAWILWAHQSYSATCGSNTATYTWPTSEISSAATITWANWVLYADTIGAEAAVARDVRVVSAEERERWRKRERELEAAAAEARAARLAADERAEALLRSLLTPQQREELVRSNRFFLHVGDKRYRVDRGQHGNVKLVDSKDAVIESYCIQPAGGLPNADAMAAQLLMLETDEAKFLRVANVSDRQGQLIRHGVHA